MESPSRGDSWEWPCRCASGTKNSQALHQDIPLAVVERGSAGEPASRAGRRARGPGPRDRPAPAAAAITIGTVRTARVSNTATVNVANVGISGADRYLLVSVCYGPEADQRTTSVVLDPGGPSQTALTHLDGATAVFDNDCLCELYGTLAPPIGTFTVRAIIQVAVGAAYDLTAGAWPLSGVDQTTPRGTVVANGQDTGNGNPTVTVSSAAGEIVFGAAHVEDATSLQIQSPGVEDWEISLNDSGAGTHAPGASSVTLNWTAAPNNDDKFAAIAVAIKPARVIAYSVGTNTADLKTGSPTIAIAGGVATLSVAQAGPVGVGDVIQYGAAPLVYIEQVLSPTQFNVQLAAGGAPANTGAVAVTSIKRAFNSITSAVTQSLTASYLNNASLVAVNRRLTWVCYKDGPLLESATIDGYTTDANNFITLTVAGATQVANGASQRHTGTAASGTVLRPPAAAPHGISVRDRYTVVEWLDVDGTDVTTANADGLEVEFGNGQDALLRNLVLHHWPGAPAPHSTPASTASRSATRSSTPTTWASSSTATNSILHNVTIYGSTGGYGFQDAASSGHTLENVISMENSNDDFCCGNATVFNNNMSEDVTATAYYTGSGNLTLRNPLDQFVSTTGLVDLHLKPGADAVNAGKSLAATFSDDIDGQARPVAAAWDIGADEGGPVGAGGTMRVLSGSYTGNGLNNRPIFVGFQPDVVIVDRYDAANPGANNEAVLRTSTMIGDASKNMDRGAGGVALAPNLVKTLDTQGFTIGTDNNVNQVGLTYYWVAFKAAPGQLKVGTYGGTGASQDITGVGFGPAYLMVLSAGAHNAVQKSVLMPATFSQDFNANGYTNAVRDVLADGFRVNTNAVANNGGTTYHYVALCAGSRAGGGGQLLGRRIPPTTGTSPARASGPSGSSSAGRAMPRAVKAIRPSTSRPPRA